MPSQIFQPLHSAVGGPPWACGRMQNSCILGGKSSVTGGNYCTILSLTQYSSSCVTLLFCCIISHFSRIILLLLLSVLNVFHFLLLLAPLVLGAKSWVEIRHGYQFPHMCVTQLHGVPVGRQSCSHSVWFCYHVYCPKSIWKVFLDAAAPPAPISQIIHNLWCFRVSE